MNKIQNKVQWTLISGLLILLSLPSLGYGNEKSFNKMNDYLWQMESPSEDILEMLLSKNNTENMMSKRKLKKYFHEIKQLMIAVNKLNEERPTNDVVSKSLALLNSWFQMFQKEVKEADDVPFLAYITNQFSGQLILTITFKNENKKNIAWMDYLGRELLIIQKNPSIKTSNKMLFIARKNDLRRTWMSVKNNINNNKNGRLLTSKVSLVIHKIMLEKKPYKLIELVMEELELVDDIEKYFQIK